MDTSTYSGYRFVGESNLTDYFDSMERLGLQIACNSCVAVPDSDVRYTLADAYRNFAKEASKRRLQSCIFIHSSLAAGDVVPMSEAQFQITNKVESYGERGFYASFASRTWLDYLKQLTKLFVEDYGYQWVMLGEPLYQVDIPGTRDRFFDAFQRAYPGVEYPRESAETPAYLRVQKLKTDLVVRFSEELIANAKDLGAVQVGAVARPNTPTTNCTPVNTLNTACDNGRIACFPGLDFVVINHPGPDVLSGVIRTADDTQRSPLLCYSEMLSHMSGKPVVVAGGSFGSKPQAGEAADGLEKLTRTAALCSAAAGPTGFLTCELGALHDDESRKIAVNANSLLRRVSAQVSNVAFVTSSAGTWHSAPYTYETVWQFYWAVARQLLFRDKRTMLTFTADAIQELLLMNPQVRVLILEEHFPLTAEQVSIVLKWWTGKPHRAIIVIGSGDGFSADPDRPGPRSTADAFPGLLGKIGVRQEDPPSVMLGDAGQVVLSPGTGASGLQLDGEAIAVSRIAAVRRVFGSRASVLLTDQERRHIAVQWYSGSAAAIFCGLGSSPATAPTISKLIQHVLLRMGQNDLPVIDADDGVLWNATRDGYVIIANCQDHPARATLSKRPCVYWDVLDEKLICEPDVKMNLGPQSLRVFRCTLKRSKVLDVTGAVHITSIMSGAGKADIDLYSGVETAFLCRAVPREARIDGARAAVASESKAEFHKVTLPEMTPGLHTVTLHW